jgi:hypothetical protein
VKIQYNLVSVYLLEAKIIIYLQYLAQSSHFFMTLQKLNEQLVKTQG